ncbi:MAG: winged helix DNA-binding domain-containing protein [Chloroflexota bacterium]|nr:winged helix DNA-binding domain-containing protein [Chloroflexota bacterium]
MITADIPRERLKNHHLIGGPLATPTDVIGWLGAVQAQEYAVAKWGIAQRTEGVTDAAFDSLLTDGAIIRTHVMRPTWHFVLPADLRWLLALTAPRVHAQNAGRYRQLGLDAALFDRVNVLFAGALSGGKQLTRAELAMVLADAGIDTAGQRLAYLLMQAELDAVICSGGRRGKQFTYALFEERVPSAPHRDRDDALAELARRYFASHGPATAHDFAWWSGLTVTDARRGTALAGSALVEVSIDGRTYWTNATTAVDQGIGRAVHLLPIHDEYIGSYKDYSPIFDAGLSDRTPAGSDTLLGNILVVDGKVAGGWRRTVRSREVVVTIDPLIPLGEAETAAVGAEANRFGRFMQRPVRIVMPGTH